MASENDNLLARLHRFASSQDENFITESLANLLRYLINKEPIAAIYILNHITNNRLKINKDGIKSTDIVTQVNTDSGKPDIAISTTDHLAYLEIKVDSDFGYNQLKRYFKELSNSNQPNTSLLVLTRYPILVGDQDTIPDFSFRWHDLVDWLIGIDSQVENKVSSFLINQFVDFLKIRGLAMEKVSWELVSGIKSLQALTDMISEALEAQEIPRHRSSAAWDWRGFYLDEKRLFVGVYLRSPNLVVFNTEVALSKKIPDEIPIGRLEGAGWRNDLDLTSEDVHFFARSKASQMQCLEEFIKESFDFARTLVR